MGNNVSDATIILAGTNPVTFTSTGAGSNNETTLKITFPVKVLKETKPIILTTASGWLYHFDFNYGFNYRIENGKRVYTLPSLTGTYYISTAKPSRFA